MSGCGSHCHNCTSHHECVENGCPICGNKGLEVDFETVKSLTLNKNIEELNESFYLCTHKACRVAYYSLNRKIMVNEISVPIWFKHTKDEYYICYCRRITLNDVMEAVKEDYLTKDKIIEYLNKTEVIQDCLHNNPTGRCCDQLFDNAIKYALNKK